MTANRSTASKRPTAPPAAAVAALLVTLAGLLTFAGCDGDKPSARKANGPTSANPPRRSAPAPRPPEPTTLAEARQGFRTTLLRQESAKEPVPTPSAASGLRVVRYDSPAGSLAAYLSDIPADGKKRPAIVWVFGGFDNGIGDTAWEPAEPENDQSAAAFRQAGVVTMYPSLRGGNDNPGFKEGIYGEVDDVLAAADFLVKQPGVDPARIYLGGHSTGGTLALLAAATGGSRFRAVFSFGPIDDVANYGQDSLPFDASDERERLVRAPARWLADIPCPTFVFEGADQPGNLSSLQAMMRKTPRNPALHFYAVPRANHFSVLGFGTRAVAAKVARDTGPTVGMTFGPRDFAGGTGGR